MIIGLLVATLLVVFFLLVVVTMLHSRINGIEEHLVVMAKMMLKDKVASKVDGLFDELLKNIKKEVANEKTIKTNGANKHQNKSRPK